MVVVGLDVTHQVMITDDHLAKLRDEAGQTGDFLWQSSRFYIDFYFSKGAARDKQVRQCAMHDAAALVYVVAPDAFELISGSARVIESGVAAGQLAFDRMGYQYATDDWANRSTGNAACMQVDVPRVLGLFIDTIIANKLT